MPNRQLATVSKKSRDTPPVSLETLKALRVNKPRRLTHKHDDLILFNNGAGDFTDVTIKCRDKEWKAHRLILAARCSFFRACLESPCKESETRIIELNDESPKACETLLEYLYTGKVKGFATSKSGDVTGYVCNSMRAHKNVDADLLVSLFGMADKYDLPQLSDIGLDYLEVCPRFHEDEKEHSRVLIETAIGLDTTLPETVHILHAKELLCQNLLHTGYVHEILDANSTALLRSSSSIACKLLLMQSAAVKNGVKPRKCPRCRGLVCVYHSKLYCMKCLSK